MKAAKPVQMKKSHGISESSGIVLYHTTHTGTRQKLGFLAQQQRSSMRPARTRSRACRHAPRQRPPGEKEGRTNMIPSYSSASHYRTLQQTTVTSAGENLPWPRSPIGTPLNP